MFDKVTRFLKLVKQLFPTGRAFRIPVGSYLESLHRALNESIIQFHSDSLSTFDSIFPDNDNYTEEDASAWERRFGLIDGTGKDLEDRKQAIFQKLAQPGKARARSHYLYLQLQLQNAGFDLYVHENIFPQYPSGEGPRTPFEVAEDFSPGSGALIFEDMQHGDAQHGDFQSRRYNNVVANFLDVFKDSTYNHNGNLRTSFFIGGEQLGEFADVPANREEELRHLILRVKPVQNIGYLFVNFI